MNVGHRPESWTTLYLAVASAAATLAGLLFVALSLNLTKIVNTPAHRERARQTIGASSVSSSSRSLSSFPARIRACWGASWWPSASPRLESCSAGETQQALGPSRSRGNNPVPAPIKCSCYLHGCGIIIAVASITPSDRLHRRGIWTCRYHRREMGALIGPTLDDAGLVERVAGGDEDALGQLYDHFGQAIYSLCLRIVRDGATAEELTQEVFVRLWRSAASFQPERGRVSTWLLRIAHNLALNELRRRQSRPVVAPDVDWDATSAGLADTSDESDPVLAADMRERAAVVRRALAQLPTPQRHAIELAFFGGLSQAEVAAAQGEPLGTVKSRIRVGMQRLRELLVVAGIDGVDEVG